MSNIPNHSPSPAQRATLLSVPRGVNKTKMNGISRRWAGSLTTLLLSLGLCGCTFHYDITLQNGDVIRSKNKPKLNDHGIYVYKDLNGKEQFISSMRIRQIEPAHVFSKSSSKAF